MATNVTENVGVVKTGSIQEKIANAVTAVWDKTQVPAMMNIVAEESGFNPYAINKSSGACGLFQNINCTYSLTDVDGQIRWGINYIKNRYGTPTSAWAFHLQNNWY